NDLGREQGAQRLEMCADLFAQVLGDGFRLAAQFGKLLHGWGFRGFCCHCASCLPHRWDRGKQKSLQNLALRLLHAAWSDAVRIPMASSSVLLSASARRLKVFRQKNLVAFQPAVAIAHT